MKDRDEWLKENPFRIWRGSMSSVDAIGMFGMLGATVKRLLDIEEGLAQPTPEEFAKLVELTGDSEVQQRWEAWRRRYPRPGGGAGPPR